MRAELEAISKRVWYVINNARAKGVPCNAIYVGGFSQGARIAVDVALRGPADCPLAGVIVFSGGGMREVPFPDASAAPRMRILVTHGRSDSVLGIGDGALIGQHFANASHEVTWVPFEGGHEIPPSVVTTASAFLRGETQGSAAILP